MNKISTLTALLILVACGESPEPAQGTLVPMVLTASWPVTSLAQALAPEAVTVECSLPSGADPITWQPTRIQIQAFQEAHRIVLNGAGLEGWIEGVSLPPSRIINTARPLGSVLIDRQDSLHSHGPRGTHSHGGIDPHTFLDPHQLKAMAGAIRDGFQKAWPDAAPEIEARFVELAKEIDALDRDISSLGEALNGKMLLASHPAYDYLARRYGWNLTSLDLDPEVMPTPEQMEQIAKVVIEHKPCALLWESQPSAAIEQRIQDSWGLPSVVWDPCESPPAQEPRGFIPRQRANAARLGVLLR